MDTKWLNLLILGEVLGKPFVFFELSLMLLIQVHWCVWERMKHFFEIE
jgi:hypothetical protein